MSPWIGTRFLPFWDAEWIKQLSRTRDESNHVGAGRVMNPSQLPSTRRKSNKIARLWDLIDIECSSEYACFHIRKEVLVLHFCFETSRPCVHEVPRTCGAGRYYYFHNYLLSMSNVEQCMHSDASVKMCWSHQKSIRRFQPSVSRGWQNVLKRCVTFTAHSQVTQLLLHTERDELDGWPPDVHRYIDCEWWNYGFGALNRRSSKDLLLTRFSLNALPRAQ